MGTGKSVKALSVAEGKEMHPRKRERRKACWKPRNEEKHGLKRTGEIGRNLGQNEDLSFTPYTS